MLRKLVFVGLVGVTSLIANVAAADNAAAPTVAINGVSFTDSANSTLSSPFSVSFGQADAPHFANLATTAAPGSIDRPLARYEVALTAHNASNNVDVSIAHSNGLGFNNGEIAQRSHGSQIRIGRGLVPMQRHGDQNHGHWYLFAGSEDQALIWQPGARSEFGGAGQTFALQDRVEVGDRQAGITYETHGIQASLAYVERKVRLYTGGLHASEDENFTGITLTMRH